MNPCTRPSRIPRWPQQAVISRASFLPGLCVFFFWGGGGHARDFVFVLRSRETRGIGFWCFSDAPPLVRFFCDCGGDEDYVAYFPSIGHTAPRFRRLQRKLQGELKATLSAASSSSGSRSRSRSRSPARSRQRDFDGEEGFDSERGEWLQVLQSEFGGFPSGNLGLHGYRIVPLIRYTPHIKDIPYKKSGRPTQKNRGPRRRSTVLSHGLSS